MYISTPKVTFERSKTNAVTNQMRKRKPPQLRVKGPDSSFRSPRKSRRTIIGETQNFKTGQSVQFASDLERKALQYLFCSATIHNVKRNETSIQWYDGRRLREHTPDFQGLLVNGAPVFIEVKSRVFLRRSDIFWKFDVIKSQARKAGLAYLLITEDHICDQTRMRAIVELCSYGSVDTVCEQLVDKILSLFKIKSNLSIGEVVERLHMSAAEARACLMHLTANNILKISLDEIVGPHTIFTGEVA
ncbi:hypothetical protein [Ahrensia sp. 13_GOM-1096m]|uniref:hypothetical protein n=1 Tax=Ahrensia sp. 13_GOM-1096m TaxID=1380380 RepID=UPI00047E6568|nr:hypothetical protein [Ahrensia sp. 13_GOM-1096m]